jgi:hypothetical protein
MELDMAKHGISESQGAKILGISDEEMDNMVNGHFSDMPKKTSSVMPDRWRCM